MRKTYQTRRQQSHYLWVTTCSCNFPPHHSIFPNKNGQESKSPMLCFNPRLLCLKLNYGFRYDILAKTIPFNFQQSLDFLFIKQIHYYLI